MTAAAHSTAQPVSGLGALLRQAREAAGLSQGELARQLNLGARIVEAMENEDLAHLPSAVYVHGYLRKWAEVLQLDESTLQQAYTRLAGVPRKEALRHTTPIEPMRLKKSAASFPWGKLLVVLIVLGLGYASTQFMPESMRFLDAPSVPLQNSNGSNASEPLAPAAPLPTIPLTLPQPVVKEEPKPVTLPGIVVGESVPTGATPSENKSVQTTPPITEVPTSGLQLQGTGNDQGSWVRVKDVSGKVLFEGVIASGSAKQVDGQRPFELTIGRATDLRIDLDGQPVDLKPYTRANGKAFIAKLGTAREQ